MPTPRDLAAPRFIASLRTERRHAGLKSLPISVTLLLASGAVRAGNDEGIALGDVAALTANSVAATVADGSSLFYNPAGLAAVERNQIDVAGTVTTLRFYSLPAYLATTSGANGDGSFTEFLSVPSAVSYVRGIGKDWRLAFGLFVPESSSWTIDVPLETSGNIFHLSVSNRQSLYYGIVGIGHRLSPRVRVGASLAVLYLSRLATASAWAEYNDSAGPVQTLGVSELFTLDAIGGTMSIGVQWEPMPRLHVGASIRAPVLAFMSSLRGSIVEDSATTAPPATDIRVTAVSDTAGGVHQVRAMRPRLGVAWTWGTSFVSVEGDFQPKVTDEELAGRRPSTWNVRGGGMLAVSRQAWLGFGAFTDRSAESPPISATDTRLNFYGVTTGVRIDNPHDLAPEEPARDVVFSTTIALKYAYGIGDVGGVVFEASPAPPGQPPFRDVSVEATVQELAVYLGSTLYF